MLEWEREFEVEDDKEYEIETIINSIIYNKKIANNQMLSFYYFVLWKDYPKPENIKEPPAVVIHFWKLINIFHKEHLQKPIATSSFLNLIPPMARPIVLKKLK